MSLVTSLSDNRNVLDYGCGSGAFVRALQPLPGIEVIGYEPYMVERVDVGLPIFRELPAVESAGPFDVITVLELVEHLGDEELREFLSVADRMLAEGGKILFSAPIEIGPAVLMKELNRCLLFKRLPENSAMELVCASFLGLASKRAEDIKASHKGFDFRTTVRFLKEHFGPVTIASYGPLPIGTWYGNSQVYFWLTRRTA